MKTNMLSAVLLAGMMFGVGAAYADNPHNGGDYPGSSCDEGNASFCDNETDVDNSFNYSETNVDVDVDKEYNYTDNSINVNTGGFLVGEEGPFVGGLDGVAVQLNAHTSQIAVDNVTNNHAGRNISVSPQAVGNNINDETYRDLNAIQVNAKAGQKATANVKFNNSGVDTNVNATAVGNNISTKNVGLTAQVNARTSQQSTVNVRSNFAGRDLATGATSVGNNLSINR